MLKIYVHLVVSILYTIHRNILWLLFDLSDHPEQVDYLITIIRCIISCHGDALSLPSYLPGVPDHCSPSFPAFFLSFSLSQEWTGYYNDIVSGSLSIIELDVLNMSRICPLS